MKLCRSHSCVLLKAVSCPVVQVARLGFVHIYDVMLQIFKDFLCLGYSRHVMLKRALIH